MKTVMTIMVGLVVVAAAVFAFFMVDIDQTQSAELPSVDIDVESGQAPAYDVEVGDIAIGQTQFDVEVPEVDVTTRTEQVTLPTLDITPPEEDVAQNDQ